MHQAESANSCAEMNLQDALQKKLEKKKKKEARDKAKRGAQAAENGTAAAESGPTAEDAQTVLADEVATTAAAEAQSEQGGEEIPQAGEEAAGKADAAEDSNTKENQSVQKEEQENREMDDMATAPAAGSEEAGAANVSSQEAVEASDAAVVDHNDEVAAAAAASAAAAEEQAILEKVKREMEAEEAAEAEREAAERAERLRIEAEREAAEKEREQRQQEEKRLKQERLAETKARKEEAKAAAAAAAEAVKTARAEPLRQKTALKSPRKPSQPGGVDSDLEAKLATRRARAEVGGPGEPQAHVVTSPLRLPASGGGGGDSDLMAKLSARKARAEAQEEVPPAPPPAAEILAKMGVGNEATDVEERRDELVSFLAGAGELPGPIELSGATQAGLTGAKGDGESVTTPPPPSDFDVGAMMIGHGALLGHGGGWGAVSEEAPMHTGAEYLPPYDPTGVGMGGGDAQLEEIIKESLAGHGFGWDNAGSGNQLENALEEALAGHLPSFDPLKEVPVNWNTAAVASSNGVDIAEAQAEVESSGVLFGMKIGTLEVSTAEAGSSVPQPATYLSEMALGPLTAAGDVPMQKVAGWQSSAMDGSATMADGVPFPFPATGAQRRALIAEREREMRRQKQMALELSMIQQQQAQARFAEFKGPPCGIGMALQASTRMLMGTLRNHKRWVIEVESLLPDGPAAKCGQILPGDVLLSVREASDKTATAVSNRVDDAKALIMGPPGSVVVLRFTRGDTMKEHTNASFEVSLVREAVTHPPPLPAGGAPVDEEVDWALLPEQATVEPSDIPLSLDGVPLASMSDEKLQSLLTGPAGKTAEIILRKKDGSQARVAVLKSPSPASAHELMQMLHGEKREVPPAEMRLMGSRTLAKLASALPTPSSSVLGAGHKVATAKSSDAGMSAYAVGGWLSRVGGKVGGFWGRSAASDGAADASAPGPTSGSSSGRENSEVHPSLPVQSHETQPSSAAGEGGGAEEEWEVVNSPSKGDNGEGQGEGAWEASDDGLTIRALLEEKRLPADEIALRLHNELGVCTREDFGYLEPQDVSNLNLAPVLTRKLLELIKEHKSSSPVIVATEGASDGDKGHVADLKDKETSGKSAKLRAQQAQQFLLNREAQKRARETELLKLQQSLHTKRADATPCAGAEQNVSVAKAAGAAKEECRAIASYQAAAGHEVSITAGETITVVRKHPSGWWEGVTAAGQTGWFPSTYVSLVRVADAVETSAAQIGLSTVVESMPMADAAEPVASLPGSGGESAVAPAGAGGAGGEDGTEAPAGGEATDGDEEASPQADDDDEAAVAADEVFDSAA